MNNKAQTLGLILISSIFFFIVGLMCVNFLMPEITTFRADLNCASPATITDGTKLLCLVGDSVVIYWIILVFSIVIGAITSRMFI
jgi:hypothetical protein